jgi:hypothetical protein
MLSPGKAHRHILIPLVSLALVFQLSSSQVPSIAEQLPTVDLVVAVPTSTRRTSAIELW